MRRTMSSISASCTYPAVSGNGARRPRLSAFRRTTPLLYAAIITLVAAQNAKALVIGSLGGGVGSFATLSSPTPGVLGTGGILSGPASGTINGGTVFLNSTVFANDVVPGEPFLATGPTAGGFDILSTSTLSFTTPLTYVSFLWGSPETFNVLTVSSTGGPSQIFTASSLGFPVTNGDPSFNQSVQFTAVADSVITSLVFSSPLNSFEVGRFSGISAPTTASVPEPASMALFTMGVLGLGLAARRACRGV